LELSGAQVLGTFAKYLSNEQKARIVWEKPSKNCLIYCIVYIFKAEVSVCFEHYEGFRQKSTSVLGLTDEISVIIVQNY